MRPSIILLVSFLLLIGLCQAMEVSTRGQAAAEPSPLSLPRDSFEYHPGRDISTATREDMDLSRLLTDNQWHPLNRFTIEALESHQDLYLRIKLPNMQWTQPAVYLSAFLNGFEVYLETKPIYRYGDVGDAETPAEGFNYLENHIITIPEAYSGQFLLLRINYRVPNNFGEIYALMIGDREDIYQIMLQEQAQNYKSGIQELLFGYLLILIGLLSLCTFLIRWKARDYAFLSFGFFSICVGLRYLNTLNLLLHATLSPLVYDYIESLTFLLVPVGLFAFVENVFGPGWRSVVRRLWQFHLVLAIVFIGLTYFHLAYDFTVVNVFMLVGCSICIGVILKSKRFSRPRIKILFTGFCVLFIIMLLGKLLEIIGVITIVYDLFGWGTLVLIFALGYILVQHYTETDQRMRSVSLELVRNKNELLKLQRANVESQLEALKNQINPHFLFNTFSTLVSIIEDNHHLAVDYVQELSKLYRYVLQTKVSELVALKEELDFVRSYEFLLSKRFGEKFSVHVEVPDSDLERLIPPLSLQLLIENAVKHNVISSKRPLSIEIYKEGNYLVVKNNIQKKRTAQHSTRIGLKNIRDRYRFFTENPIQIIADQGYFIVKIPFLNHSEAESCR